VKVAWLEYQPTYLEQEYVAPQAAWLEPFLYKKEI